MGSSRLSFASSEDLAEILDLTPGSVSIMGLMNDKAGRVRLAAGTLYGALNALCDKGWIIQLPIEDGSRKKQYKLTDKGLQVLKGELDRLRQLVANGESILKEEA